VRPYPFSAVVGMDDLKLALLINAVAPGVGGVLVRGEKGTAKSTVVRALAALLPDLAVVSGCRFSCDPADPDPECPDGPHTPQGVDAVELHRHEVPGEAEVVELGAMQPEVPEVPDEPARGPAEVLELGATTQMVELTVAAPAGPDTDAVVRPARLVELPVGASEDRLTGSLDIERALTEGVKAYEPGLLAAAHRGVLYVDEVNLLHDHLVDLLLDAAAMGRAFVEREGVSIRHAARFLLVGTMNPEEGELRPQLLDRFGLTVEVAATRVPEERAEVVRRRLRYEDDPESFANGWKDEELQLGERIATARALLPEVRLPDAALRQITAVCAAFEVDGLRADLVTARAAIALAAWHGRATVHDEDVRAAARLALPHRRRRDPFDAPGLDQAKLDEILDEHSPPDETPPDGSPPEGSGPDGGVDDAGRSDALDSGRPNDGAGDDTGQADAPSAPAGSGRSETVPAGQAYKPRVFTVDGLGEGAPGRRSKARSPYGRVSGSVPGSRGLHLTATLRAAAPHQRARGRVGAGLIVAADDLRRTVREGREGNLVLFVVDASGSMAARKRMSTVKAAALSLLLDAYQRRDKVGLVTFRGTGAEVALPPTSSVEAGARRLENLPTGGRTPLAAGLRTAADVLRIERLRDPSRRPLLVIVTDGRATHGPDPMRAAALLAGVQTVVVDCETGPVRLGLAVALGVRLGAEVVPLEELGSLAGVVRRQRRVNAGKAA
jgi:magnesium chelatase subunit D